MGIPRLLKQLVALFVLLLVLFYVAMFGTMIYQSMRAPIVTMDDDDVQYVLDWVGQTDTPVQLLSSYHPPANWAGDFEKMFTLKIDRKIAESLVLRPDVVRGDQLPADLVSSVEFAMFFTQDIAWFPPGSELLSSEYYLWPIHTLAQFDALDSVHLLFISPDSELLFFVEAKM